MSGNTNSCGCRFGLATKVAKKANASLTSVSLVMNNKWKNQLTKEKAEKIKKTAEEFDYRPYYNRR